MSLPPRKIQLPYVPRRQFWSFHQRTQRWACLVVHRRGGKTVSVVNDLICVPECGRGAFMKPGNYAYIAPYRSQAKSVAWDYFKYYARPILHPKKVPNEAELKLTLMNEATLQLFGADNADAMRGMGFDGVAMDEYGDFRPSVWGNVIRPTLSDKKGWAVFMGTPKGHNQFYDVYKMALGDPSWFVMKLPASESGLLDSEELAAARTQLSEDQYNQEYECSFDAAILGAFYGREMARVDAEGRIGRVEYQEGFPVNTAWDLGYTDDTAIWWYQNVGNEVHVLDHYAMSGGTIEEFVAELKARPYRYGTHWLPHDARAKTMASGGKSIMEQMARLVGYAKLAIVPQLSVEDGIQAVRQMLSRTWFDRKCEDGGTTSGIEALRQYQREYDEDKKVFRKVPLHNWASHSADAFRMLAVAERQGPVAAPTSGMFRQRDEMLAIQAMIDRERNITLDELWAEKDEQEQRMVRI